MIATSDNTGITSTHTFAKTKQNIVLIVMNISNFWKTSEDLNHIHIQIIINLNNQRNSSVSQ